MKETDSYWKETLSAFRNSLRGLPIQQRTIMRVARWFVRLLRQRQMRYPDEEVFQEWLDWVLVHFRKTATIAHYVSCLEQFCAFLAVERENRSNPVREWRIKQVQDNLKDNAGDHTENEAQLVETLERVKQTRQEKISMPRPCRFESFLSSRMEAFVIHKRTLGRGYDKIYPLNHLDRRLMEQGVENLAGIDEHFLSAFLHDILAGKTQSTRMAAIIQLRQLFHFLVRRGDLAQEHSPARFLPRVVRPSPTLFMFTLKEIAAVLSCLRKDIAPSPFDGQMLFTFFHLIYACGLRISEAIRLRVQDVDFEAKTLFIKDTKFGKSRLIPMGKRAAEYMQDFHSLRVSGIGLPGCDARFFVRAVGLPYCRAYLEDFFNRACREAGIIPQHGPKPRVHDLRHALAVHRLYKWYLEGADPREKVQLLSLYLGHCRVSDTQHYLHLAHDLLRIAGRPMERQIGMWLNERKKSEED
jgi:site-specific recombinase XerD